MTSNTMIARTGRVQNWLDDPTDAVVEDAMWGKNGITDSWLFSTYALQNGAGVAIHLYKLRPKGSIGSTGKVASGPNAFMPIYSAINDAVMRSKRESLQVRCNRPAPGPRPPRHHGLPHHGAGQAPVGEAMRQHYSGNLGCCTC